MRMLPHNADLSANPVQPVFLLLPPALLAFSPLRFVKCLAGVDGARAHVDHFVHSSERATSQFPFPNIDGELPGSEGSTRLCGRRVAVDSKSIERRKISAPLLQKILHVLVVFGFARLVAGHIDLEAQPPNMDLDFPLPLLLWRVQNPGEVMPHFLLGLVAVTEGRSIGGGIPQDQMPFAIDRVHESNTEMQPTHATRTSRSQNDIATLGVGAKRVAFASILWRLVEGQLQAMRGVVLAVLVIRLFLGGCGLPA